MNATKTNDTNRPPYKTVRGLIAAYCVGETNEFTAAVARLVAEGVPISDAAESVLYTGRQDA
jgi:hypothetical protein